MRASVVGLGYVGLVTAAGLAEWGHDVIGLEVSAQRLDSLRAGRLPLHEPGLDDLFERHTASGALKFTDSSTAVASSHVAIIAVGTHDGNGGWQTETLRACLATLVPLLPDDGVLVIRSTLPPEFLPELVTIVDGLRDEAGRPRIAILTNPEFTREGNAVADFLQPERIVIGVVSDPTGHGLHTMQQIYRAATAPLLVMDAKDAVLTKLAANLFLAMKISFANELAALCEAFDGDVVSVVKGMSYDSRIGGSFLRPGVGFGGSCLPNQVSMTIRSAAAAGVRMPLLRAVDDINHEQRTEFVARIARAIDRPLDGARIALLGLTFKPATDDLRDAPALTIAGSLLEAGATVVAYDPMPRARSGAVGILPALRVVESAEAAIEGADAVALVTEWPEFTSLDWDSLRHRMTGSVVVDGRNALDGNAVIDAGLEYIGYGRRLNTARDVPATVEFALPEMASIEAPVDSLVR